MTLRHIVFDDSALAALGAGNRLASRLVAFAHDDSGVILYVPTLSLVAADLEREGVAEHIGMLETLQTVGLDYAGSLAVASLAHEGVELGVAHAVHVAQPGAHCPVGAVVATARPTAHYRKFGVRTQPLG